MKRHNSAALSVQDLARINAQIANLICGSDGAMHLHRIQRFLKDQNPDIMVDQWKRQLSDLATWDKAKENHAATGHLWYNLPEWPFQIACLTIGGTTSRTLRTKINDRENPLSPVFTKPFTKKDKHVVHLIRLRLSLLGYASGQLYSYADIACRHDEYLFTCGEDTEIAAKLSVHSGDHAFDEETYVVAKPFDRNGIDSLIHFSAYENGSLKVGTRGIDFEKKVFDGGSKKTFWVFQYLFDIQSS